MAGRGGYAGGGGGAAAPGAAAEPGAAPAEPSWVAATGERRELNQYWFSERTITAYVAEIEQQSSKGVAFLSTPSLYFSLKDPELRKKSRVFEFDRQWESDPGFVFYDYRKPEQVSIALFGAFDYVVIDPPFITEECWRAYATTARLLLAEGGKVLGTSIAENTPMLATVAGLAAQPFRPSIPNLVYQYETFTSYAPTVHLAEPNPEVPAAGSATDALQRAERESHDEFAQQMQARDRSGEAQLPETLAAKNKWDRVPEGLTEYPDGQTAPPAAQAAAHDQYGDEYARVAALRERVGECRRLIDAACKPLDRNWKMAVSIRKAEKAGDAGKRAQAEADREAAGAEFARLLGEMREQASELERLGPSAEWQILTVRARQVGAATAETVKEAMAMLEPMMPRSLTKAEYQDSMPIVQQRFLSPLFNHQKTLLAEMKEAKKRASTPGAP